MRFMHRHRRWLSLSVLAGLFAAMTTPPASAEYNPRIGRYLQQDPNGQALVLQALRHNAENPMVTVSMAYQLQYGDGMNFYEYLRSNPANRRDPSGLTSSLESAWAAAQEEWGKYLETAGGRAWTGRIERIGDAWDAFGDRGSGFDSDVFDAIDSLLANRIQGLEHLEKASFQLRYGHKKSMMFAAGNFAWDDVVWERDEAILVGLVAGLPLSRACFVEGTQVLLNDGSTESIEDLSIGSKVATWTDAPRMGILETWIDSDSWRLIRLVAEDAERGAIRVNLLRPAEWIESNDAVVDDLIYFSVPGIGIQGPATVTSIEPCPESAQGPATGTVTGTFATDRAKTIDVYFDSLDVPIGATGEHPVYSIDRSGWVGAGDLCPGERVRTVAGAATVDRVEPRADAESVYNLEIAGTHTYFVSTANVLVHNACSVNQANQAVRRGKAPKSILRIEHGRGNEVPHVHFSDGHALFKNGVWKHGGRVLTRAEKAFLKAIDWILP